MLCLASPTGDADIGSQESPGTWTWTEASLTGLKGWGILE